MSGYQDIIRMQRLIKECDELGFMMAYSKYGSSQALGDVVALKPKDADAVPIYTRDAEIFTGTLEQLEVWLRGVSWAREYDRMLRVSNDKKRVRKEQDYRNQRLMDQLAEQENKEDIA